jgi:Rrf2 family nitric oxide-sensitive transcriptional repressor
VGKNLRGGKAGILPNARPIATGQQNRRAVDKADIDRYLLPQIGITDSYLAYLAMRLSLQTDFALRALIYLAGRPRRASAASIAEFYGVSKDHMAKAAQQLVRAGFVRAIRGAGGGLELARPAEEIRLGEVILAFEGSMRLLDCVAMPNLCVIQPACKLRGVLAQAERVQLEFLNSVRLADVVEPGGELIELLAPATSH